MQCPHLSAKERTKICRRMLEDGLDGVIADFDLNHYCRGNPTCCYYFRKSTEDRMRNEKSLKTERKAFATASQSL